MSKSNFVSFFKLLPLEFEYLRAALLKFNFHLVVVMLDYYSTFTESFYIIFYSFDTINGLENIDLVFCFFGDSNSFGRKNSRDGDLIVGGGIPTASDEFPLPDYFPTASEDRFPLLSSTSKGSAKKKGRTVAVTTKDMQKRMNDVKARTTLLLALPDKHQLRFSKYKTAQELLAAILKTFGGNEATKKTKKNS
nr:hypothetical protein [Tanacetum cinerariifolium]